MSSTELQSMLVEHVIGDISRDSGKPVTYTMQGDGLWEVRRSPLGIFCRQLAQARIPGLKDGLKAGFDLAIPLIPAPFLGRAISFFRRVYDEHGTEAVLRFLYDKGKACYIIECPEQIVTVASAKFRRNAVDHSRYVLVADIHSHGGMTAHFSGTDNRDELADMFYVVVGRLNSLFPAMRVRLRLGGQEFELKDEDLFSSDGGFSTNEPFPEEWLDKVKIGKILRRPSTPRSYTDAELRMFAEDHHRQLLIDRAMEEFDEEGLPRELNFDDPACWFGLDSDGKEE